jgi:hypothetical protein
LNKVAPSALAEDNKGDMKELVQGEAAPEMKV